MRSGVDRSTDALLGVAVAGIVALLVLPVPPAVLDVLLTLQLAGAVAVLLAAARAHAPSALTALPSVILLSALLRLGLNLSTARLVLSRGEAGTVVAAFGDAVVAGDLVAGFVVFAVLCVAQYVVVARGAERVAEVAARFALDGLPGQQLAIDAEVRAGALDADGARGRRRVLSAESHFFGAMDGAMKFVRGEAIAGLCIVGVNLAGGVAVGVVRRGLSLDEALSTYAVLAIGDGLLAQIPSLLHATAAGLVVARAADSGSVSAGLGAAIGQQFLGHSAGLVAVGGLLVVLGVTPGLPGLAFVPIGGALAVGGLWRARRSPPTGSAIAALGLRLHPQAVEALDKSPEAVVASARRRLLEEYGVDAPPVDVRIDDTLPAGEVVVEVAEAPVARGRLPAGRVFVPARSRLHLGVAPETGAPGTGVETGSPLPAVAPETGAPGAWVEGGQGLAPSAWLARFCVATWRRRAGSLSGVQAVSERLAALEVTQPALVRAVIPRRVDTPRLAALLRHMLAEDLPVRDLAGVLEALAAAPEPCATPVEQMRAIRGGLAALRTHRLAAAGHLEVIAAAPALEQALRSGAGPTPSHAEDLATELGSILGRHPVAVLLVAPDVREPAAALLQAWLPGLPIVSAEELLPGTPTRVVALAGA